MGEMDHDRLREALAPYALGALAPEEAAELEHHVERCADCRAELVWLTPAVRMLPEAVDQVEPPPPLRRRVMAEVEADAGRGAEPAAARRRRLPAFGLRPATAVFVGLAIAVAVATGFAIGGGGDPASRTEVSRAGVTAELTREGESGTLELAGVRSLPPERVLQAWVRRDGEVESAGVLFAPDEDGTAVAALDHLEGVGTVMVTVEPRGGSDAPTSEPIAALAVPSA